MLINTKDKNKFIIKYNPKKDTLLLWKSSEYNSRLKVKLNSSEYNLYYTTSNEAEINHKNIINQIQQPNKGETKMGAIKEYFEKHQETCITLAVIILVDYFIFDGAFQEKIKSMMNKAIGSIEDKISKGEKTDEATGA